MLVCYTFNIAVEQYYNSTGCVDLLQFIGTEWLQKSDIQKYNLLNTNNPFYEGRVVEINFTDWLLTEQIVPNLNTVKTEG